ncbi:hypothetical protein ACJX0J_011283, partial [Zea mays]
TRGHVVLRDNEVLVLLRNLFLATCSLDHKRANSVLLLMHIAHMEFILWMKPTTIWAFEDKIPIHGNGVHALNHHATFDGRFMS